MNEAKFVGQMKSSQGLTIWENEVHSIDEVIVESSEDRQAALSELNSGSAADLNAVVAVETAKAVDRSGNNNPCKQSGKCFATGYVPYQSACTWPIAQRARVDSQ
jgi:hypothetical protein